MVAGVCSHSTSNTRFYINLHGSEYHSSYREQKGEQA